MNVDKSYLIHVADCAWVCSLCGQVPMFERYRLEHGFGMRAAVCVTDGCPGGVYKARRVAL